MVAISQVWNDFLVIVCQEVGSRVVETWLKSLVLERWDESARTVYVRAPNAFVREWVQNHYRALFCEHLARLFAVTSVQVVFVDKEREDVLAPAIVPARLITEEINQPSKKNQTINITYQFDTFVVGPSNSLSYAAAHAVTQRPGFVYNPLFVYGGSGLGKTHLMHAIGNEIKKKYRKLTVLYQPADRFVNEFIHAIRFNKVDLFKEKYRAIDVLLIDDIQFIAHKEQTQEAFFHIFNSLYESSKQIVFSSDTYPKAMHGIAERLRSRFEWGLITDVQMPTLEERVAILKRKAEVMKNTLADDVACAIAEQPMTSVRELEGTLIRLFAFSSLTNQPVNVELVRKIAQRPQVGGGRRTVNIEQIAERVAQTYQYTLAQLRSKSRNKEITLIRQVAMFLMKKLSDASLLDIAICLRRKDHSTVAHAVTKIEDLLAHDAQLKSVIETVERSFGH